MIPKTLIELEQVRKECKTMVAQKAVISGTANLVPIPGADIAVDIALLMQLLPTINKRFGLSPEQIETLDPQMKMFVYNIIIKSGPQLAGQLITKQLIITILKRMGIRIGAKQVAKFVPIIGQGAAFAISIAAMKYVGDAHVEECYNLAKEIVQTGKFT